MNECVFIYRRYHIVSQGGLQFYLSEIGRHYYYYYHYHYRYRYHYGYRCYYLQLQLVTSDSLCLNFALSPAIWFFAVARERAYEGLHSTRLSALLVSWLDRSRARVSRAITALVPGQT